MRRGAALPVLETTVVSEWVDYNGHMNDAAYAIVFSRSVDALMDRVGLDAAARKRTGQTLFTLQMMLHYFKEAKEGDALRRLLSVARARRQAHARLARDDRAGRRAPRRLRAASDLGRAKAEGKRAPLPGASRPKPRSKRSPRRRAACPIRPRREQAWR